MISRNNIFFWLCTAIVFTIIIAVPLFMDGMFCDALLYTTVSHNMAQGLGTFWFPFTSKLTYNGLITFHEQPPLLIYIQNIFYKIFGLSIYTDRIYVLFTFLSTILIMYKLWLLVIADKVAGKATAWLPILMFVICPIVMWSYTNAIQEVGMGVFTTMAVYFLLKNLITSNQNWWLYLLAALSIFAASLSKGVPGFYPLIVPFLYWLVFRNHSFLKMVGITFYLCFINIATYAFLIFTIPDAKKSLSIYFFTRLLSRVNSAPTVSNRFDIFYRLFLDVLPWIVLVVIIAWFLKKRKKVIITNTHKQMAALLLFIGLCGALPLALTKVQRNFYYLPAMPLLALSASVFLFQSVLYFTSIVHFFKSKLAILFMSLLLVISIGVVFLKAGTPKRDASLLHDLYIIKNNVPTFSEFSVRSELWENWSFQQYYMRYLNINFNNQDTTLQYFLIPNSETAPNALLYKKMDLPLLDVQLFQKIK
jgi:4-amino-4-deoxy-L-arabinose transferase-like glycosyltransferase